MKYFNIFFAVFAVILIQACNPMDDILDELEVPNTVVADLDITLTEDDYDLVGQGFGNFSSEDDAKDLIPEILTANYPQLGQGSSAVVAYDLYSPVRINNEYADTVRTADYDSLGFSYGNLSSVGDIADVIAYKFPDAGAGDVVTLTYEWYCNGCPDQGTLTSKLANYDGRWYVSYVPTADDYTFMGQLYPNFDSRTTARERIAYVLSDRYPFAEAGDIRTAVFTYTYVPDGGSRVFEDFLVVFEFDGSEWVAFQDVVQSSLQLGHDGNTWVPDNTIKYSLTAADYAAIADATSSSNPGGSGSVAQYGNFDLGLWSSEQILEAIGARLLDIFPAVEGQKYLVSYDTWEPGAGVRDLHVIYQGGTYVEVQ